MKPIFAAVVLFGSACAWGAMTAKTSWAQRWPWNTKVDVDFELSGGEKCDIAVIASFTTNGVAGTVDLERSAATECDGFWELEPGMYHLVWDPAAEGLDVTTLENFSVTVTPIENASTERQWLVLDLDDNTWDYVSGTTGTNWNDNVHKTSKMVFRRIPAGSFVAGLSSEQVEYLNAPFAGGDGYYISPQVTMTITHDYYIAIYKMTVGQQYRLFNMRGESTSEWPYNYSDMWYPTLRGSNNVDGIDWPITKFAVKDGSQIDIFREHFNNRFVIDLPTSAQWENAARAGTTTFWYNGGDTSTSYEECTNLVNEISFSWFMSGVSEYGQTTVGSCAPNSYGLYDVLGLRPEYILDRFVSASTAASEAYDPVGPTNGTTRITRGTFNQKNHGLRYFTHSQIVLQDIDNMAPNTALAVRFAIHLRPPYSFGNKWK